MYTIIPTIWGTSIGASLDPIDIVPSQRHETSRLLRGRIVIHRTHQLVWNVDFHNRPSAIAHHLHPFAILPVHALMGRGDETPISVNDLLDPVHGWCLGNDLPGVLIAKLTKHPANGMRRPRTVE